MVAYMGPYIMTAEKRSRIRRLAAARGISPEEMVNQLIDAGLAAEDPDESVSGRDDVDLTSACARRMAAMK
jgi:hypothetical protein